MKTSLLRFQPAILAASVFTTLSFSPAAKACVLNASRDPQLSGGSYETRRTFSYDDSGLIEPKSAIVSDCKADAGKFLMVSLGYDETAVRSNQVVTKLDATATETGCQLDASPFPNSSSQSEKSGYAQDHFKFLQQCTFVKVTDRLRDHLDAPQAHEGCDFTSLDAHSGMFSTGPCFFRVDAGSQLEFSTGLRAECTRRDYLKGAGLTPQDLPSSLVVNLVGDASGYSEDFKALGHLSARISLDPGKELLPQTDTAGFDGPRWPTQWVGDVHFGEIQLQRNGDEASVLSVPLLVDHRCSRSCEGGLCSSPCDYLLPVAAETSLSRLGRGGQKELLSSWYTGGVAAPQWQGELHGIPAILFGMGVGRNENDWYEVEARFGDPQTDFTMLRSHFDQFVIDLGVLAGRIAGRDNLPSIPNIHTGRELPELPQGPGLNGPLTGEEYSEISKTLETLRKFLGFSLWPPAYSQVCDSFNGHCSKTSAYSTHTTLRAVFQLKKGATPNQFEVRNLRVTRESREADSYNRSLNQLPGYSCGPRTN